MLSRRHTQRAKLLAVLLLMPLLLLAACGSTSSTGGNSSNPNSSIHLTVGGKLDTEAQLLTKMYVLLLRKAGYTVTEKAALGTNNVVFSAISSGQIDLYPEFTATGLTKLGITSTNNADTDYAAVKAGYEKNYHITWLDKSPLNDTYGICAPKNSSKLHGATSISQLAPYASSLSVATPPDGVQYGVDVVKSTYHITFGGGVTTYNEEGLTFPAVTGGNQSVNICYTTAALIAKDNFFVLQDDKNAFPVYNPAPIVRDSTLAKAPGIKDALNPLAPYLTTEVSQELQKDVVDGQSVTTVATNFLKSKNLL